MAQIPSPALQLADFGVAPALSIDTLRRCETWLTDAAFAEKVTILWPQGTWKVVRGFPAGYWADLHQLDPAVIPGGEGVCFGDAHFDNFGFIHNRDADGYLYSCNDLDDSGLGLVALDALKYFFVMADHPQLQRFLDLCLDQYVAVVDDPARAMKLPARLVPDPVATRRKKLEKYVAADKIRMDQLSYPGERLDAAAIAELQAAVQLLPQFRQSAVLDAARLTKLSGGGSFDEPRLWLVLDQGPMGAPELVEWKTMTTPGTTFGRQSTPMSQSQRIQFVKRAFWQTSDVDDHFVVNLHDTEYLVRSRLNRASLYPLQLKESKDIEPVLRAQVSYLADLHRPALAGVAKDRLRYWLRESQALVCRRWAAMMAQTTTAPDAVRGDTRGTVPL